MLDVTDLTVAFNGRAVVSHVDLRLATGEMVGLIGPNGAGKTSLVRAAAGLLPHDGTIMLDGIDTAGLSRRDRARQVAYLAQGATVHWPIRARDLVALGRLPFLSSLRRPTDHDSAAIGRAMDRTDVTAFADRDVRTLSAGERARVLLARALAAEAPLLLADEPVAALDPYHQLHIMGLLREYAAAGAVVLVVLHDLSLAARYCHRLALMHDGRLMTIGPPDDVLSESNLESAYHIKAMRGTVDGAPYIVPRDIVPAVSEAR